MMATLGDVCDPSWYVDSGATHHVVAKLENPKSLIEYKGKRKLVIEKGEGIKIHKIGDSYQLSTQNKHLALNNVLVVPKISKNMLSIVQFTKDNDESMNFNASCYVVKGNLLGKPLLEERLHEGLYQFGCVVIGSNYIFNTLHMTIPTASRFHEYGHHQQLVALLGSKKSGCLSNKKNVNVLHSRLGHPSFPVLKKVVKLNELPVMSLSDFEFCSSCEYGENRKLSFQHS